ncbi:MAG: hypothetical protein ACXU8N_16945 [Telluria sp.]
MKTIVRCAAGLCAAAASITLYAQEAQPQLATPEVQITVQAAPLRHYYMAPEEVHRVSGAYRMDDHSVVHVSDRHGVLYVEMNDRTVALRPAAENVFVTPDRSMALATTDRWDPDIAISYRPDTALASSRAVLLGGALAER